MIALDPVVPILGRVVEHFWEQVIDNAQQRSCPIRGDFSWPVTTRQHCLEELGGRCDVAAFRHRNLDDLAVLVDCAVHVAPHTSHLHIGFVDKPAITNTLTTRPRCVDRERSEALHPSLNGDMVDLDAAFGEKFFDIAVREYVAEISAHCQQDHVRWEPGSCKRRRNRAATTTTTKHPGTLGPHPIVNATVPS